MKAVHISHVASVCTYVNQAVGKTRRRSGRGGGHVDILGLLKGHQNKAQPYNGERQFRDTYHCQGRGGGTNQQLFMQALTAKGIFPP